MGLMKLMSALTGVLTMATVSKGVITELPNALTEVDVIIAGGGTSGSIVASRLAETDPSLSILVVEQGQDSYNVTNVIYPALFERNTLPDSKTALFWKAKKSPQLANREPVVETGGTLGGGSAINWMVYTRGQWDDFDSWNTPGWSADDLLPFIQKVETYHGATNNESTHGYNGPIQVSKGTHEAPRAERGWIDGAVDAGFAEIEDLQSLHSNNGSGPWYRYVSPEDGRRQDVAHRYLYPLLQSGEYPNLHVLVETQVLRVLFEGEKKRAVGIEMRANPNFAQSGRDNSTKTVKARKLVIASAGSFGTPLLLERSGVGDPEVLEKAGVPVVESLLGVGNDFQDHHFVGYVYRTNLGPNETINGMVRNDRGRDVEAMIASDDKQLGWNGHDASSKLRPSPADVSAIGPEFQAAWDKDFKDSPNRPLMIMGLFNAYFGDPDALPDDAEYVTTAPWVTYPYARGHIHITGPVVDDAYDFESGWLLDENDIDLKSHIWGYKTQRSIARRMSIFRGELASGHPYFANTSSAAVIGLAEGPVTDAIEYSADDDAAIVQYIRENIGTSRHPLGTCKMAPREENGVVDLNLNVHGVSGLKIADLSVPPRQVAANTYNAALLLGEKAADIIITELKLLER
ncbi:GMC oxidoreductase [Colletotrichum navitas]|uniref:GMC oxidoreductase n=1 Tax=Colletotrichum navitas TaxID=681940 RepID=A0AAD8PXN1_9PEZI|nr:GMC oxidoreductase [Colletotrichum navitas]KAK1585944.1 GMC oxidoreductase [Colletotrichum navitas]